MTVKLNEGLKYFKKIKLIYQSAITAILLYTNPKSEERFVTKAEQNI